MMTVIIATNNRPKQIRACIKSILRISLNKYSIIVIDQSDNEQTQKALRGFKDKRIISLHQTSRGKSRALNAGIDLVPRGIVAFTDDDCVASPSWLSEVSESFEKNPGVSAVFGRTLSYRPAYHKDKTCPCVFLDKTPRVIKKPILHYKHIGFGNNMAVRKSLFEEIGNFKEWLGPGSIGSNAEDAEMALRLLIKGHNILYNPNMVVYHNKWLNEREMKRQNLSYVCGEMACYGYFHFQGHRFATPVVLNNIRDSYYKTKNILKRILSLQWNKELLKNIYDATGEIFYRARGLIIGFLYSLIDPIR